MPDSSDQVLSQFFSMDQADTDVIRAKVQSGISFADFVAAAGSGGGGGGFVERMRKKGSTGIMGKRWNYAGSVAASLSTTVPGTNVLFAAPVLSGPGGNISDLAFENTGIAGAGGVVRLGFYANLVGDVYPGAKLYDSGDIAIDVATGLKAKSGLTIPVVADSLYWTVLTVGVAAATLRAVAQSASWMFWGVAVGATDFGVNVNFALSHAQAYGVLPDPFPTSAPSLGTTNPLVAYTLV